MALLPPREQVQDAVCRLRLTYPRDWEPLLDEAALYDYFEEALQIQLQKHRQVSKRARLGDTVGVESLSPEELLAKYWQTLGLEDDEAQAMQDLAKEVLGSVEIGD